jgi:hypothetical protein
MFDDGPSFSWFGLSLISQNGINCPLIKFLKMIEEKVEKRREKLADLYHCKLLFAGQFMLKMRLFMFPLSLTSTLYS